MKKIKNFLKKTISNKIFQWFLIAFILNFFCDTLNQRSIIEAIVRLFTKPLNFIFNTMIIMMTVSLCGFFKKRNFALIICCLPWIIIAIANFIVQFFRRTPLSFIDLKLIFSVFSVFNNYLSIFEMILIGIGIVALIAGLVVLYKKEVKKDRLFKYSISSTIVILLLALIIRMPLINIGSLSDDYSNLTNAYKEYGLPYCFVVSIIDRNVDKPEEYSKELVEDSIKQLDKYLEQLGIQAASDITINGEQKPNVIFLQLESFVDPKNILNLEYSEDPTPFFTYLKDNYPSGTFNVPSFGAGTANVEFEIMTGLNLNYFGAGEYPYTSVLTKHTAESIGYILKDNDYYTTVIHNNRASFYDRNKVFENLGYNRFVSSEFMINLEETQRGWYKDSCLSYEIMKALKASEESDFIYTISVQPHGQYLDDMDEIINKKIIVNPKNKIDDELLAQYTYYVNQVNEVDLFIKNLTEQLANYNEPVMLVTYGDHWPNFALENEDVLHNDIYKTEYVIWTNYDINLEDKNISTYELSSYVLQSIGCTDGIINKLHQTRELNNKYEQMYLLFEYDMFSKEKYMYNGNSPYQSIDMQLGYNDTKIDSVSYVNNQIIIKGINFNINSTVYFGKNRKKTIYIDSNTLIVDVESVTKDIDVIVKQVSNQNEVYSSSNTVTLDN